MRSEKALYKGIPLLIEALVHGENWYEMPVVRSSFSAEFQIDKHSRNVLRGKRTVGRKQCPFQILRGEQKDKFKIRRSAFALDQVKTLRTYLFKRGEKKVPSVRAHRLHLMNKNRAGSCRLSSR